MASEYGPQVSRITIDFVIHDDQFDDEPVNGGPKAPIYTRFNHPGSLMVGDVVRFDYRAENDSVRTRVGQVAEVDRFNESVLILDYLRMEPRRSHFRGMSNLYIIT